MDSTEAEMATTALKNSNNVEPSSSITLDDRINALLLPFQCSFCNEIFRGHFRLLRHIVRVHDTKIQIECGICHTVYFKPQIYAVHLFNKHLDGASPDLIEKLKTEFGFYEKWKRKPEIGKYQKKKARMNQMLSRNDNDQEPRPKKLKPNAKSKADPKPKPKYTQKRQSKSSQKNQESFACTCGQKLMSQEHLEVHKSAHNIRIDPTIKCHLCAGAFDSVDDWLLHNCQRDVNANLEQAFHRPEPDQVTSPSLLVPECADFSVASPASSTQDCDSPVASPSSPPQDCESPVASPASPPQNCDSPVGSPGSPSPECDFPDPAPSSTSRTRDDFTELLKTFQKVIDDLPPPTRQPLDHVPPVVSSSLDDLGHDDDDMECASPSISPQNSEGQGTNDPEVPPEPTAVTVQESQGASDLCEQSQEPQKEILVIDLASSPPAPAQQQDCEASKTSSKVKKSRRDPKNPNGKGSKHKQLTPEDPEDLQVHNYLCKFNLQPFYKCDRCPARYKFKLHLVEHKHKYCQGNSGKSSEYNGCRMCGQEFSSKSELEAHLDSRHKEFRAGSWACDLCDNVYDWERALKFHKDTTHKIRERPLRICRLCSKPLKTIEEICKHYDTEHHEHRYTLCRACGQQFKDRYEKVEHKNKEHGRKEEKFVCEVCGKEMANKSSLGKHMKLKHTEKNFLCTNCGQGFASLEILQSHEFTHLPKEDQPFRCKFCSYASAHSLTLLTHMGRHHLDHEGFVESGVKGKEKPFVCDQCGKAYTNEIALEEHKIFHGERTYKCRKCDEYMCTNYHLVAHQQIVHWNEQNKLAEPRPCPHSNCSKTFTTRACWYAHRRTCRHGSTRSYTKIQSTKCDECGKIYKSKADLTYHINSAHLKTLVYHCEVCGKGSNSKSNLKAHMKLHGGGYECQVCNLRFLTFPTLNKHSLDQHGKELPRAPRKPYGFTQQLKSIVEGLKEPSGMPQEVNDPVEQTNK